MMGWTEHALWNALYPLPAGVLCAVIGLLPHVLPIRGGVLQFPCDKGFSLPEITNQTPKLEFRVYHSM